ncbi:MULTISPECIES: hypothetical protein [Desulfobacter]|jgi:hypothetical protein|uniref:Uncharacterized protein n=1 Tax=Desulfobacter postgatei 2ac9 TaxID=879212 RepID=I5B6N3_9BACT|nr:MULTISPECIES: hypothetical protein [Desulfobacter]HRF91168.1 hypothetical protein [Desulfobacter postgatei]EIM65146.1 hypothetical protein DespoDRAFT_03377 [Desulfobacter postgatei 2ac9]MBP8828960.1 hypothetical protein [Desulfobacter sp.]MBP9599316.1 hypothetical protein [Desulfobacter sp.]HBT89893.1 hypothetical protein [Desulfobacter sp.]
MDNQTIKRDLFDFEVGYLTQSPCVNCEFREHLPKCHADCIILDQIQTRLARGISSQSSGYES